MKSTPLEWISSSHPAPFLARVLGIIAVTEGAVMFFLLPALPTMPAFAENLVDISALTFVAGPLLWFTTIRPSRRQADQQKQNAEERHRSLAEETRRRGLERRLQQGMEMASSEAEVLHVAKAALAEVCTGGPSTVLLADSSHARFRQRVQAGEGAVCDVKSPIDCPAVQHMRTVVFEANEPVARCPRMRDLPMDAVCVPVSILGRAAGVLHRCRPAGSAPLEGAERHGMHAIATHAGTRLGTLRAVAEIQRQASTDALTGVMNRRAAGEQVAALFDGGETISVAIADLDHFKRINDVHGHHAGDLALVAFTRVAQDVLKGFGGIGRWGGEEFLIWVNQDVAGATRVLEALRARIGAMSEPGVPKISATFGLCERGAVDSFELALRRCDEALYRGKEQGRDRVVIG